MAVTVALNLMEAKIIIVCFVVYIKDTTPTSISEHQSAICLFEEATGKFLT